MINQEPLELRFWRQVDKPYEGCWNWTGADNGEGYGNIRIDRLNYKAHRVAWMLTYGEIPIKMFVLQTCANGLCCRPDHLYLGTHNDNINYKLELEQIEAFTKNGKQRLNWERARAIRIDHVENPRMLKQLAVDHGVSEMTASYIVRNITWRETDERSTSSE